MEQERLAATYGQVAVALTADQPNSDSVLPALCAAGSSAGVLHTMRNHKQEPVRLELCGLHSAAGHGLLDGECGHPPWQSLAVQL